MPVQLNINDMRCFSADLTIMAGNKEQKKARSIAGFFIAL